MHNTGKKKSGADLGSAVSVYDQIVRSVADHLRQQGFSTVRANSEGFSPPGKVKWEEEDEGVVPDLTGEHNGSVYVFEIVSRDHIEAQKVEDRWRLLSVYAKRYNGKFYLVIPETKVGYLQELVKDLNLKPEFLKLRGLE